MLSKLARVTFSVNVSVSVNDFCTISGRVPFLCWYQGPVKISLHQILEPLLGEVFLFAHTTPKIPDASLTLYSWLQAQYEKQRNDYNDNPEHHLYDTALTHTAALPAICLLPRILGGKH